MTTVRAPPEPKVAEALPTRARPVVPDQSRVLVVGDSHVEALGPALASDARRERVRVGNLFQRGTRLDQWAPGGAQWPRLEAQLARRPSHVVVALGTNDGLANASDERVQRNARALIERIRAVGAEPVFTLPLRVDARHEPAMQRLRAALTTTLREQNVPFVDPSRTAIPRYDDVHATPAGYATWARQLWRTLQP